MTTNDILLSTVYLGPVQYFTKFIKHDNVFIEQHENYIKQSYRNRCIILGANGPLTLSIPITKIEIKTKTKDILIDNDQNWRKMHWKSIESAYRSSPFFDFYEDDFYEFYDKKRKYLLDFNVELTEYLLDALSIDQKIVLTDDYHHTPEMMLDFREVMHPKPQKDKEDLSFKCSKYYQVFSEKYDFVPNLSVIDLLFNEGSQAYSILESSII